MLLLYLCVAGYCPMQCPVQQQPHLHVAGCPQDCDMTPCDLLACKSTSKSQGDMLYSCQLRHRVDPISPQKLIYRFSASKVRSEAESEIAMLSQMHDEDGIISA
jgi:hypothetical protein